MQSLTVYFLLKLFWVGLSSYHKILQLDSYACALIHTK